jgi:hypothetical protein
LYRGWGLYFSVLWQRLLREQPEQAEVPDLLRRWIMKTIAATAAASTIPRTIAEARFMIKYAFSLQNYVFS